MGVVHSGGHGRIIDSGPSDLGMSENRLHP